MRKRQIVEALRMQRERTLTRLGALAAEDWDRDCLPGWRVRDVAAHLVASDQAAVTLRILAPIVGAPSRQAFERWNDQAVLCWRDQPPGQLLAALDRWGGRLRRLARSAPSPLLSVPLGTPYGRQDLGFLLHLRVHDEWVHEQDVAWAVEGGTGAVVTVPPPLAVAEAVADTVLAVLPRLVLPKVPRRAGVVRLVVEPASPEGAVTARPTVWGMDFARRQYGPRVTTRPDAEMRVQAGALGLIMESRLSWRALGPPWLALEGEEELAADVLDVLPLNRPGEAGPG